MQINNYQKAVGSWGILIFIGYIAQNILHKYNLVIIRWSIIIAIALFIQIFLLWNDDRVSFGTQITWIVISIIGGALTYFLWSGSIMTDLKINVFWFIIVSIGMGVTLILTKNISYLILLGLYIISAIIFQVFDFDNDLIYAGLIFLILGFVDVFLESSPLRKTK